MLKNPARFRALVIGLVFFFLLFYTPFIFSNAFGQTVIPTPGTSTPPGTSQSPASPTTSGSTLLSKGKPIAASSQKGGFEAAKANDGIVIGSYWEASNHIYPSILTVDLGSVLMINKVVMKLDWGTRTENVEILGSLDNINFTTIVPAANYSIGSVPVTFANTNARYVRLKINSNSAASAAQMAEFEVWGGGSTATPTATPSPTFIPTQTPSTTPGTSQSPASPTPTQSPASPTPTPINTVTPSPTTTPWEIRSVDVMKVTKDNVCGQSDSQLINKVLDRAQEIGANYVAIATPYDNPGCGNAVAYGKLWADAIHARGLKVWHRHMPLAHEGIYGAAKNNQDDFFDIISNYIVNNPGLFVSGDIFTPIPEPQNGGINGITVCYSSVCQYSGQAEFNKWIKSSMLVSELSFAKINKTGIKIGYFGFDAFVAWGHNNPNWNGILYNSTITRMGNILAIDHYPEAVGTEMGKDLDELHALYPNVDVIISEWGTISGTNTEAQVLKSMGEAKQRPYVKGFNYWQFGPNNTNESLIDSNFLPKAQFDEVKSFYK